MMYKHAKGKPRDDSDRLRPHRHAVIAWRVGRDNRGRRRVYRRVWAEPSSTRARARWASLADLYEDALLIVDREEVARRGTGCLVGEWLEMRRGVNRGADPVWSSGYMWRECIGDDADWMVRP